MTDENVQGQENAGTEETPAQPTPPAPTPPASPPAKKPRSPVEKLFVWGLIGVLLIVAVIEGQALYGYTQTLAALTEKIEETEKSDGGSDLAASEINGMLKGLFVTQSDVTQEGAKYYVNCQWRSLFKSYVIKVKVSSMKPDAVVLGLETDAPPDPNVISPVQVAGDDEAEIPGTEDMAGGPGFGGPPGGAGGPGFGGPPGGAGGPGGPGGSGRARTPRGMMGQLTDEAVQAELKLTDDQKSKIEELGQGPRPDFSAFREMSAEERTAFFTERRQKTEADIKAILNEEQFARVRQLTLRAAGLSSLSQSDVQADLKLTDEQKEKLSALLQDRGVALRGIGRDASAEDRQKFNEEWDGRLTAALTDEQQAAWEKLLGPPPAEQKTEVAKEPAVEKKKEAPKTAKKEAPKTVKKEAPKTAKKEAPKTAKKEKESTETKKEKTAAKDE